MSWPEAFAATIILLGAIVTIGQVLEKAIEMAGEIWVAKLISQAKSAVINKGEDESEGVEDESEGVEE